MEVIFNQLGILSIFYYEDIIMKKIALKTIVASSLLAISMGASAASDGTLGSTSTGSIDVILNQNVTSAQITGLSNLVLNNGNGYFDSDTNICVFSNTGQYDLVAQSSNPDGTTFRMLASNGANPVQYVEYELFWQDDNGFGDELDHNGSLQTKLGGTPLVASTSTTCNDGVESSVFAYLNLDGSTLPIDTYSDTVSLEVTPI